MRRLKTTVLVITVIITVMLLTGCTTYQNFKEAFFSNKGETGDTVRIGVLEPQTGNDSGKGELEIRGIELANKMVPEVLGKKIELVYADTQSSIYVAETAAVDLTNKEPCVVLGSYGDAVSLVAGQIFGEEKIPAITITATNPLITENNEYYFRVTFTDASQGRAAASFVHDYLNLDEAAVIRMQNEDTAAEMVSEFGKTFRKLTDNGDSVVTTIEIPKDTRDFTEYMEELKESGAEAVFMPISLKNAEKLFQAADKLGITGITFIGPKDWHTDDLIRLQQQFSGIRIAAASDFASSIADEAEATELYEQFIAAYKEEYGEGEPAEETALAFDAYMIAIDAIEKAGTVDGDAVKNALQQTSGFEGVSGEISFDDSGEPTKTINIDLIENNRFVSVYTVK